MEGALSLNSILAREAFIGNKQTKSLSEKKLFLWAAQAFWLFRSRHTTYAPAMAGRGLINALKLILEKNECFYGWEAEMPIVYNQQ